MAVDPRSAYVYRLEPGEAGAALAFVFHGTGGTEGQLLPLARDLMPGATLIAPRGDVDEAGALRFFRRKAEGLYDMADLARATDKMAGFVAAQVADHAPSRVVGIGYSNGANILASLVFARRDMFDAAVLMHPLISWEPAPGPVRTRLLITAGERDPICPPALTRQLAEWFAAQGAAVDTHWQPGGHSVEASEVAAATRFLSEPRVAAGGEAR